MTQLTGSVLYRSDGTEIYNGDVLYEGYKYDIRHQTLNNGAATLSAKFTVPGEDTYYLSITVPEGRKFYLYDRVLTLEEGNYDIDVVTADSFTAGATVNTTNTPLNSEAATSVQTVLTYGVTNVVNPVVREYGIEDTGTGQGNSRARGAVGVQGVFKVFTGSSLLRITKNDSGDARGAIQLICWEEAA